VDGDIGVSLSFEARGHTVSLHGTIGKLYIVLNRVQFPSSAAKVVPPDAAASQARRTLTSNAQTRGRSLTPSLLEYHNTAHTAISSIPRYQARNASFEQENLVRAHGQDVYRCSTKEHCDTGADGN
jgi:hypothetical protein